MTNSTSELLSVEGSDPSESEYSTEYEYKNDRLISVTSSESVPGSITYKQTYDYDGNGKFIKYTYTMGAGDLTRSTVYDFETKKFIMESVIGVEAEGELNADGYVIKEVNAAGVERTYQYDDYGNLTHMEAWMDGNLYKASDYEYDNKVNPNYKFGAQIKGMPDLKVYRIISPIHNYTKEIHYEADDQGQKIIRSKKVYALKYNTTGYPTIVTNIESNAQGEIISTNTTTYSYQDCE